MTTAVQQIIIILEELVGDDGAGRDKLNAFKAELAADEGKQIDDEAAVAALVARVAALEGAGSTPVDLGPLTDRVAALEARNAADDAAAGGAGGPAPLTPPISALTLSPATLPDGVVGAPYTASVSAAGSTALPFAFSIASGALPDGLSLGAGGGISGVPTTAGSSQVSIQAHDANGDVGSVDYTMVVGDVVAQPPTLVVSPAAVSAAVGVASTAVLSISGGVAPYTADGLPAGVTFDGSNLVFDTTTVAGDTAVTISDASTPALTASVDVTIA